MNPMRYIPAEMAPLRESSIPNDFGFDRNNLQLSYYLTTVVPPGFHVLIYRTRDAAMTAVRSMRELNDVRQLRFAAVCPEDGADRFHRHKIVINQLIAWSEDYNTAEPTVAPTTKIPRMAVEGLHISRQAYERYTENYNGHLQGFMDGPYNQYGLQGENLNLAIEIAEHQETFNGEMEKWTSFIPRLALPTYEEVVGDLYEAIRECVEDADGLIEENKSNAATGS
ncbi:uncharacterized protein BDV17DRAFT_294829 [Aspergillus undulatus]|uniref:uncharacterized protein n=1 Tax=Aspergillus undulatus TaxID=1810928 RepID=UPI003CCD0FCB